MILESLHWHIEYWGSSSILHTFSMTETVLNQSAQFEFLDMSAGNVLGGMRGGECDLLLWSILGQGNCLNSEDRDGGGVALAENYG